MATRTLRPAAPAPPTQPGRQQAKPRITTNLLAIPPPLPTSPVTRPRRRRSHPSRGRTMRIKQLILRSSRRASTPLPATNAVPSVSSSERTYTRSRRSHPLRCRGYRRSSIYLFFSFSFLRNPFYDNNILLSVNLPSTCPRFPSRRRGQRMPSFLSPLTSRYDKRLLTVVFPSRA